MRSMPASERCSCWLREQLLSPKKRSVANFALRPADDSRRKACSATEMCEIRDRIRAAVPIMPIVAEISTDRPNTYLSQIEWKRPIAS